MKSSSRAIRSVLIVDDDRNLLSACARSLRRGRKVFIATNASTARKIARVRRTLDAAIADLRLGMTTGIDLVRELKREQPDMLIAMVSGYLSVAAAMAAVRAGADAVLSKPISPRAILRHLEAGTTPEPNLDETPTLARVEWEHISRVLADTDGNISEAAHRLGLYRQTLQRRLRKKPPKAGR